MEQAGSCIMQAGWRESEPLPLEDMKPSMNSSGPHYFGARRGFRGPRGPMGQLVVALGHGWWWPPLDEAPPSFSLYTPTIHGRPRKAGRTRPSKTSLWMQISLSLGNYLQITKYPPGNNRAGTNARGMPNMTTRSTILSSLFFFSVVMRSLETRIPCPPAQLFLQNLTVTPSTSTRGGHPSVHAALLPAARDNGLERGKASGGLISPWGSEDMGQNTAPGAAPGAEHGHPRPACPVSSSLPSCSCLCPSTTRNL